MENEKQDQPKKQEAKQPYFFPNVKQGLPFSCEAESREKAEEANKQHLKQQKDNN